ncbi:MAG: hypothetical protein P1U56_03895 [Saprospiraceae bacterium]|nr:hypothetical protein [Saprospiraceae bacterium]
MKHNYTEKKLIQLIYGECDIFDRLEMEYSLENNLCLKENYDELYKAYKALPKVKFSPKNSTINNIISYGNGKLETAAC